ncbi:MAG: YidC/Oxa1 family membrane protein insertase [Clostridiales bacterium]|nr:YidC/Oxa1 family membrane protein insertase [Clostridiales bacterium]
MVFFYAYKYSQNVVFSIIIISLAVNFLVLPLYKRADELQAEERDIQAKMAPRLKKIKKTFKGDERFFIIQEFYRINHYKPIYAMKSSASLLLQIPFFIAAYSFLSELKLMQGCFFGPIADFGAPDALLNIGGFGINILPILMTAVNVISGLIYTKGHPIKTKIQLYGLAAVFLALLYQSPSGLVFYWLLNNVFSLCKNVVYKIVKVAPDQKKNKYAIKFSKGSFSVIMLSCATLAVLTGVMIPSDVLVQNPAEMVNTFSFNPHSPLLYLVVSTLIAVGAFMLWVPVFAYLTRNIEKIYSIIFPCIAIVGVFNYFLFNKNFGFLSNKLIYDNRMSFELKDIMINLLTDLAISGVAVFVAFKWKKTIRMIMVVSLIVVSFFSVMRVASIAIFASNFNYYYSNTADEVSIPMTTTGKNVVVLMMDKMNSSNIPYIFNERPDVAAQFDGFIYYPNTVSFGKYTNFGTPSLFGGYDYTPARINARSDESLESKQNEALLVMPVIFSENGWKVTVADPSYAGYQWKPDLSIYDQYEGINAYHMSGVFNERVPVLASTGEEMEERLNRNLFCYGFMKTLPYLLQPIAYTDGEYFYLNLVNMSYTGNSQHIQNGYSEWHMQEHAALDALSDVTTITDDPVNCFFVMSNGSTHDICLLQEPEYTSVPYVDNTEFDAAHEDRFTLDGKTLRMDTDFRNYSDYECSMEACITLGKWFDYLRENGLYDNTRIIIVADHGFGQCQVEDLLVKDINFDAQAFNPVLLYKDFNSTGFTVCSDLMTNADTPSLALYDIVDDPINSFTGNPIFQDMKSGDLLIYSSENLNVYTNRGNTFVDPDGFWLTVHDNIYDDENWTRLPGEPG